MRHAFFVLAFTAVFLASCTNNSNTPTAGIDSAGQGGDSAASVDGHPAWIAQGNIYEVNVRQYTPEGTFKAFEPSLQRLKDMGVQISVDDFGTGYSALSYLRNFPVDVIKIDQSLVQHLPFNRQDVAIASSIISLAHNLGIKVVAEGVESTDQLAFLRTQSCTSAQGYLFQPPVPAQLLEILMRRGHWSHMTAVN